MPLRLPSPPLLASLPTRTLLNLLAVACLLPMVLVAAYIVYDSYRDHRSQAVAASLTRARAIASALDRELGRAQDVLQTLANSPYLQNDDLAEFQRSAQMALNILHSDSVVLVDPGGQLLMSTKRPFGEPLPKLPAAPLAERILQTKKPGVSDLFVGPIVGQPIVTVGVPVWRRGQVAMTLNATIDPRQLANLLKEQRLPGSWRIGIFDAAGKLVARSHETEIYLGRPMPARLAELRKNAAEGTLDGNTLDGLEVATAYSRSELTQWSVVIGIPREELAEPARQLALRLLLLTVLAGAMGLLAARLAGARITRSLAALRPLAAALGQGQLLPPMAPLPLREAEEVAQALQAASHTVQAALQSSAAAQATLKENEADLRRAQRQARLGSWKMQVASGEVTWSEEMYRLFERDPAAGPIGRADVEERFTPESWQRLHAAIELSLATGMPYECDAEVIRADGSRFWIASRGEALRDAEGKVIGLAGTSQDIAERKEAEVLRRREADSRHHALHDALTGLPGQVLFLADVERRANQEEGGSRPFGVLCIGVEGLPEGTAGDTVRRELARRLSACVRKSDIVARLDQDEFVVLLDHVDSEDNLPLMLGKIAGLLRAPVPLRQDGDQQCLPQVALGAAVHPRDGRTAAELVRHADAKMFVARMALRAT